jgi:hypothetical protein
MLGVTTETVTSALDQIERVSSWPIQALNIALFVLVLGVCYLYLRSSRGDLIKLQKVHEEERKEYIASLKSILAENTKVIERNTTIFDRLDRKMDRSNGK